MDARGGEPTQEIARLCLDLTDAIRNRDDVTLTRLLADDFTFTSERGRWDKTRFIENTRRWQLVGKGMSFQDVRVRAFGTVVVYQARVELQATLDGRQMSGEWYLTDIWVDQGVGWQVVARQWSRSASVERS